ncbi:MAG TPA: T9SS type A sorting domain-containing protein [Chitinophagales bacterium]|nr:T9SS type A sorting domain-containing protein [Chitinophagales bacterium]
MKKIFFTFFIICVMLGLSKRSDAQAPVKKVLLEEFTTASCGNCPMMSKYVNEWHLANEANTILISIHEGSGVDAMSNTTTATIFNLMHPTGGWFAPAMMINRGIYDSTGGEAYLSCYQSWGSGAGPGVDSIASRLITEPALAGVNIAGTYNSATRYLDATVHCVFVDTISSGPWSISLFLVEDSVVGYPNLGPFDGWDQHCYDATWANTNYPGMFDGTSIIGYPHRHVMRDALLGSWGAAYIIPSVPVVGTDYSAHATITVDTAYHDNHLSLVAFVSANGATKAQKFLLNANDVKLSSAFTTGVTNLSVVNDEIIIFPNPATDEIFIKGFSFFGKTSVSVFDMEGREIISNENYRGETINISSLENGIYLVKIKSAKGPAVNKLVKN